MTTTREKMLSGQYVVIPSDSGDEDYEKRLNVVEYVNKPILLAYQNLYLAGTGTSKLDLTQADAFGVYIQVSAATTVSMQILTASGWEQFYVYGNPVQIVFSGADYYFIEAWMLPFEIVRFVTSDTVTWTIQAFIRM